MEKKFNIKFEGENGQFELEDATRLPFKEEFVEQMDSVEYYCGALKKVTITFKK